MPDPADEAATKPARPRGVAGTIWALEHAQDFVTVAVGVVLIGLAAVLVVDGLASFFHMVHTGRAIPAAATALLDRVLLVLILVEIVHTVAPSLGLTISPRKLFIIVGLVAVIRRILVVLSGDGEGLRPRSSALLIADAVRLRRLAARRQLVRPARELSYRTSVQTAGAVVVPCWPEADSTTVPTTKQ